MASEGKSHGWLRKLTMQKAWNLCGFIDDDKAIHGKEENGYKVLGGCDYLKTFYCDYGAVCAVRNAVIRKEIVERVSSFNHIHFATLIDPDTKISELIHIGEGIIICAGNTITVNIKIGRHNIIDLDCTVGHDIVFKNFVTLYSSVNVSGCVGFLLYIPMR